MDPVYPPQSDGASETAAGNVAGKGAGHAQATIADVIANMSGIVDGVQELRNEVADAKSMGQSLRVEIDQIRNESRAGGVSDHGGFGQELHQDDDFRSQGGSVVDFVLPGEKDFIPVSTAHKLYSREFESDRVTRIGDYRFPAARMTWRRFTQDFPVRPELLRRLVGVAFGGAVKKIYEEVSAKKRFLRNILTPKLMKYGTVLKLSSTIPVSKGDNVLLSIPHPGRKGLNP
jgi:hypothetical protein